MGQVQMGRAVTPPPFRGILAEMRAVISTTLTQLLETAKSLVRSVSTVQVSIAQLANVEALGGIAIVFVTSKRGIVAWKTCRRWTIRFV